MGGPYICEKPELSLIPFPNWTQSCIKAKDMLSSQSAVDVPVDIKADVVGAATSEVSHYLSMCPIFVSLLLSLFQ